MDFAILEQQPNSKKKSTPWNTLSYIGMERSGGEVGYEVFHDKKGNPLMPVLKLRYVNYSDDLKKQAASVAKVIQDYQAAVCACRKNGTGYKGHKRACPVHKARGMLIQLSKLSRMLHWWSGFKDR